MLTNQQLQAIPIDPGALELVPECVARENVVLATSVADGELNLVLPALSDVQFCLLLEKLQFVLGRTFSHQIAVTEDLARFVDLHYTAAYSTVQNCDRAFRNRCPKQWADLVVTDAPLVRWCDVCERSVHFCLTDADVDRHTIHGNCIAYYNGDSHADTLGLAEFPA